jgi:hypothetical protein
MSRFFVKIGQIQDPQRDTLVLFVDETVKLLTLLVKSKDFTVRLWRDDAQLISLAAKTLRDDVLPAAENLKVKIGKVPESQLKHHGLVGSAARFKYAVLARVSKSWRRWQGQLTARAGFRSVLEAVDAVLGSLIDAAHGSGGLIKEFKDAIMALILTR